VHVKASEAGEPISVLVGTDWLDVRSIRSPWRVDQLWWRSKPINRRYYQVAPEDGSPLTVFHDLLTGEWFMQEYR
jgi:hypothetical protein